MIRANPGFLILMLLPQIHLRFLAENLKCNLLTAQLVAWLPGYMLYTHIHEDVSRNIMTTSINEQTHFFIKVYLSHFIQKGWCWLCVRGELETETDCHILTKVPDHSSTSSSFCWAAQPGSLRARVLSLELVLTPRASYLQL